MIDLETSELIQRAYDAAGSVTRWDEFTAAYVQATGARGAWLLHFPQHPTTDCASFMAHAGHEASWLRAFDVHFRFVNPYRAAGLSMSPGRAYVSHEIVPKEIGLRSEFYTDYVAPQGFSLTTVMAKLCEDHGGASGLAVHYPPDYSDDVIEASLPRHQALVRPITAALRLHWRLVALEAAHSDLLLALESTRSAVVVCDDRGKVLTLSRDAERLLGQRDGLGYAGGRLIGRTRDGASLSVVLERVARRCGARDGGASKGLRVGRPSGRSDYELLLFPVPDRHRQGKRRVLVFVHDPQARPATSARLLAELYGLTERESRVAELLARGLSPAEIADELRMSRETVKSHLKAVYNKTETGRQAALVSKVLMSLARVSDVNDGSPSG